MDAMGANGLRVGAAKDNAKIQIEEATNRVGNNSNGLLRHFEDSTYSFAWVLQKLEENDETFKKRLNSSSITKIEYSNIGAGDGNISRIFKVDIHFTDGEGPHCVALKIPNLKCLMENFSHKFQVKAQETREESLAVRHVHGIECRFYRHFAKLPGLPLPKIFAAEEIVFGERDGAILMEFVGETGLPKPRLDPLNVKQVRSLVKGLAKVMVASLELDISELRKYEKSKKVIELQMAMVRGAAKKLLKGKPEYFEKPIKRLEHLINDAKFAHWIYANLNEELGIRPVLVHGDLWTNNVFWKKNRDGECSDELLALIDWQIAHCGTVCRDLSFLLAFGTDTHLRKEIEDEMQQYLYNCLKSELEEKNMEMPYTLEQINRCYRREFVLQAIVAIMYAIGPMEIKSDGLSDRTERLKQNVLVRMKCALEEAIGILENEMPQWLDGSR